MECRLLYSWKLDYQIEMSRYAATLKQTSPHPGVGHEHRPSRSEQLMGVEVRTNAHGFRDAEYPIEKPADEYRVMLLGDSLTLGWGARGDGIFAVGLEERLAQRIHFTRSCSSTSSDWIFHIPATGTTAIRAS